MRAVAGALYPLFQPLFAFGRIAEPVGRIALTAELVLAARLYLARLEIGVVFLAYHTWFPPMRERESSQSGIRRISIGTRIRVAKAIPSAMPLLVPKST